MESVLIAIVVGITIVASLVVIFWGLDWINGITKALRLRKAEDKYNKFIENKISEGIVVERNSHQKSIRNFEEAQTEYIEVIKKQEEKIAYYESQEISSAEEIVIEHIDGN